MDKDLGKKIEKLRKQINLSRTELGEKLGYKSKKAYDVVYAIEKTTTPIGRNRAKKLSDFFGGNALEFMR
jgi:transcriptional regulator with XRE-family HTH domain